MDRRDFLRFSAIGAAGAALAACNVRAQETSQAGVTKDIPGTPTVGPENTEDPIRKEYEEAGFVLLEDPVELNPSEFVMNDPYYPTALSDGTKFGEHHLVYGEGVFPQMTYLHYTGKIPPVAGEIIPLMYKIPRDVEEVDLEPYAIPVNKEKKRVSLDPRLEHFVMPIVITGSDSGIVPIRVDGKITNAPHKPFNVEPDPVTGNTTGYLAWAVFTMSGEDIVFEGIATNSNMAISYENVPEEVLRLLNSN